MTEIFEFCNSATHNLRSDENLKHRHNRTNNFDVESISTLGPKIWVLVPENLRQLTSLNIFKRGIKNWNPSNSVFVICNSVIVYLALFMWYSFFFFSFFFIGVD